MAEKAVRNQITKSLPGKEEIAAAKPVTVTVDVAAIVAAEKSKFEAYIMQRDLASIINRYPIRESSALSDIAIKLGFKSREQYEGAVIKLLIDDAEALTFVRGLFGDLEHDIKAA